jgi:very-short-patch-repair endonuclease
VDIHSLEQLARARHGAIHRDHAGCSTSAWSRAHRSGLLVAIHPDVSRLAGTIETLELRIAAAVLAAGDGAVASHRSAAHLWGIPRHDDDIVDVILPHRRPIRLYPGVAVHRPNDQRRLRPWVRSGVSCTTLPRTLLDLGAVDRRSVRGSVGHALAAQLTTIDELQRVVIEHSERGRHGVVALRQALEDWTIDGRPADSVLEVAMRRLVDRFDLPPVEFHPTIGGWEVDFRVVGTNVLVECDGWTHHGLVREQFERDRIRDAQLTAAGWITIRVTYRAVVRSPAATAARIRAAVERWGGSAVAGV